MIARDGWTFILIGLVLAVIAIWVATRWNNWPFFFASLLFALLTVYTAFFFRDPERTVIVEPNMLVAPADGVIVVVDTLDSHPHLGEKPVQVSIFLSVFDVHINRVPSSGTIDYVDYNHGKFLAAFVDKASEENEQTEIGMTAVGGQRLVFKQIAGLIARRIVYHLEPGEEVTAGQRFGLIRFGSRVDLLLPHDSRLLVKNGDRVVGGETVMGYLGDPAVGSPETDVKEDDARL